MTLYYAQGAPDLELTNAQCTRCHGIYDASFGEVLLPH